MIEGAAQKHRALFSYALDCGDLAGLALAALRAGLPAVVLRAPRRVQRQVAEVAAQLGAKLLTSVAAQDLGLSQHLDTDLSVWLKEG